MTCTHKEPDRRVYVEEVDDWSGQVTGEMRTIPGQSYCEDIDVGRYRCTRCGLVMYYAGRWRDHWEKGTPI